MDSLDESDRTEESRWQKSGQLWGGLLEAALMAPDGEAFVSSDPDFALFRKLEETKTIKELDALVDWHIDYRRYCSPLLDLVAKEEWNDSDLAQARIDHFTFCLDRCLCFNSSLLDEVVKLGYHDKVAYILNRWPEEEKRRGDDILLWAVKNKHVELARMMLDRGREIGSHLKIGCMVFHDAIDSGSLEMLQLLLDRGTYHQHDLDRGLLNATVAMHITLVQLLLDRGAKPEPLALHYAIKWNQPKILQLLLKHAQAIPYIRNQAPEIAQLIQEWADTHSESMS